MNKQESQNLMIGSWVLAGGEPRQVSSLTTKKAGFKRGTSGHRDFFRFDQLQGIPLSEELLKECIKVVAPQTGNTELERMEPNGHRFIQFTEKRGHTDILIIPSLHILQGYLLSRYGCTILFDRVRYKFLQQPEIIVPKHEVDSLRDHLDTLRMSLEIKPKTDDSSCSPTRS